MRRPIDQATVVRKGEELNEARLAAYLTKNTELFTDGISVAQFPGGFSNLTYLLSSGGREYVLRKPPIGADIKSAHDMGREFKVLSLLEPLYSKIPKPLFYCEDSNVIGSPFYLMQRVKGLILRNKIPEGLNMKPIDFQQLSQATVRNLADLHQLEVDKSNLISLGKPEGYVERQVEGWTKRYFKAETEEIRAMNMVAEWMQSEMPKTATTAFIHNDYKFDNLVLDPESLKIRAVLDWEMATIGDPFMDLGTTLAYWVEAGEHPALIQFNLTWVEGNLSRQELAEEYLSLTNHNAGNLLFYYVFGCFKLAVIVQQIYARYKKGHTSDPRFANLIYLVKACAANAENAIKYQRINKFY